MLTLMPGGALTRTLPVTGPPHILSHTILGGPFVACARG